jgi:serine/threonine protein kinase
MSEPTTLATYRLVRVIGSGGTSKVYEALREGSSAPVALKVLREELCRQESVVHRFRREARLLGEIAHPGIVPVLDSGCDSGRYWLAMPLVAQPTLQSVLESTGPIRVPGDSANLMKVVVSVLIALDAVHQRGVVHRDLTPRNVFVDGGERALLADFGIVKILGSESLLTRSGALVGTVPYMAPEQLSEQPVGPRTDVYQVGLIAYRMVAGRLPFESTVSDAVRAKCLYERLPDVRDQGARVPDRLAEAIGTATARDPSLRFGSAPEMAAAIDRALAPALPGAQR